MTSATLRATWTVGFSLTLLGAGCVAHLPHDVAMSSQPSPGGSASASPSGGASPSASPSSAAGCSTTADPNAVSVVITPTVLAASVTPYGVIGGYAIVAGGGFSPTAAAISARPTDTVQFFNNDVAGTGRTFSAAGIASSAIPASGAFPPSYAFPANLAQATGTTIDARGAWSTGPLMPQCYSSSFSFGGSGTFYFGDLNYYSPQNIRDVFVVR